MRRLTRCAVVAALLLATAACSSSKTSSPSASSSTSSASSPGCLPVSTAAKDRLGVPATGATKAVSPDIRGKSQWYYSTADGATWISGIDPATGEADAPTLPLNDKARSTSDVGVDIPAGAPAFGGASDGDVGAVQSRTCATKG